MIFGILLVSVSIVSTIIRMAIIIRGVVCLGKGVILIAIVGTSSNAYQPNHDDDDDDDDDQEYDDDDDNDHDVEDDYDADDDHDDDDE